MKYLVKPEPAPAAAAPILPVMTTPALGRPPLEYGCVDWFYYAGNMASDPCRENERQRERGDWPTPV